MPAKPQAWEVMEEETKRAWYLGVDFGTTGLSAVLLERVSQKLYPIYWLEHALDVETKSFRLPTAIYLSAQSLASPELPESSVSVGSLALAMALRDRDASAAHALAPLETTGLTPELLIQNLKPYLKIGIPHYAAVTDNWEPVAQWSDYRQIPLNWLQQALQTLLRTLSPATENTSNLVCGATGLETNMLKAALTQLEGVILGYPANWPDTYNFNLREAVLTAKLVARPEQIFFIEDAIAAVLSGLRNPHRPQWKGGTLAVNAGATTTEMVMVNLPDHLQELTYSDFSLRSLPYAGNVIDQDIICQLLHPQWFRQPRTANRGNIIETQWHWQADQTALDGIPWDSLGLDTLPLPIAGEPDLETRHRLQQRLESSPLGQGLLEAARHLKLILQHEDQFTFELGDQRWMIMRRQLESQVFLPFIQRLNRELNVLLSQTGLPIQAINQVVCTGGTASLPAIARWLRQKLPNATIIQDTYQSDRGLNLGHRVGPPEGIDGAETNAGEADLDIPVPGDRLVSCSRVAYGLAALPLYPQVLDLPRQQYGDYFLLLELLRAFPEQPVSVAGIMQLLERRGINTHACQLHILALLEGHLPPGLIPSEQDRNSLTDTSRQYLDAQALTAAPLFFKEGNQIYRPNLEQCQRLRAYLSQIMVNTHQTLEEPFAVNLHLSVQ